MLLLPSAVFRPLRISVLVTSLLVVMRLHCGHKDCSKILLQDHFRVGLVLAPAGNARQGLSLSSLIMDRFILPPMGRLMMIPSVCVVTQKMGLAFCGTIICSMHLLFQTLSAYSLGTGTSFGGGTFATSAR